jgi:hypothetical protein
VRVWIVKHGRTWSHFFKGMFGDDLMRLKWGVFV